MPDVALSSSVLLFADDTKCAKQICHISDCYLLQSDLNDLLSWSQQRNLHFNEEKCVVMRFSTKRSPIAPDFKYVINDKQLPVKTGCSARPTRLLGCSAELFVMLLVFKQKRQYTFLLCVHSYNCVPPPGILNFFGICVRICEKGPHPAKQTFPVRSFVAGHVDLGRLSDFFTNR